MSTLNKKRDDREFEIKPAGAYLDSLRDFAGMLGDLNSAVLSRGKEEEKDKPACNNEEEKVSSLEKEAVKEEEPQKAPPLSIQFDQIPMTAPEAHPPTIQLYRLPWFYAYRSISGFANREIARKYPSVPVLLWLHQLYNRHLQGTSTYP